MATPDDASRETPGGGRPFGALDAVIAALGALLVVELLRDVAESARPGAARDLVTLVLARVAGYGLVTVAVLARYAPGSGVRRAHGLAWPGLGRLLLAVAVGVGLAAPLGAAETALAARFPPSDEELEAVGRLLDASTPARAIALGVGLGLVVPVVEELFFRGLLYGGLERARRARDAVLVTAMCDAALHAGGRDAALLLTLALALALVRFTTASALAAAAARAAFFAVSVVPMALGRPEPTFDLRLAAAGGGLAVLAGAGLVVARRRPPAAAPAQGA